MKTILLLFISNVTLFGCSHLKISETNEGAKITNTELAASYIEQSLLANSSWLSLHMYITKYLENQGLTLKEYNERLVALKNHWELQKHPLASLKFKSVHINEDNAEVYFERTSNVTPNEVFPEITISLLWTGSSWSIVDDNFLGKGEIFDSK